MKHLILLCFVLGIVTVYSQDKQDVCNQLPYAKVDKVASPSTDLVKTISAEMLSELKKDGAHQAVFKLYVDCHGKVAKSKYESGDLNSSQQEWLMNIVDKSSWKPAVLAKKDVTSTVFVTVDINNGKVSVAIQ